MALDDELRSLAEYLDGDGPTAREVIDRAREENRRLWAQLERLRAAA